MILVTLTIFLLLFYHRNQQDFLIRMPNQKRELRNIDIPKSEFFFLIPCHISNFETIKFVQKENYLKVADKIGKIIAKSKKCRAFFYFGYNSLNDLEYSKQFSDNLYNKRISFIHPSPLPFVRNLDKIGQTVDNFTMNSNRHLSAILDRLSILSSYGFIANSEFIKKDVITSNQQFFMFFEPNFHIPNHNFLQYVDNLIFEHANFKPTIENRTIMQLFVNLKKNCVTINSPSFLCKLWDFWRISQISEFIKLTSFRLDLNSIVELYDFLVYSAKKSSESFDNTIFVQEFLHSGEQTKKIGKMAFSSLSNPNQVSKLYPLEQLKNTLISYSHYHGLIFNQSSSSSYYIIASFDVPTYVQKIYFRWNSSFDQKQKLEFEYQILLNSNIKFKSSKLEDEFIINQDVEKFKMTIICKQKKETKFSLNELIIIY
ncbi:hypothetical protein MXB_265 [Myxobolus squamalis]|nr:hypothetical protein MXB_265 [Myxobolus squamalis]